MSQIIEGAVIPEGGRDYTTRPLTLRRRLLIDAIENGVTWSLKPGNFAGKSWSDRDWLRLLRDTGDSADTDGSPMSSHVTVLYRKIHNALPVDVRVKYPIDKLIQSNSSVQSARAAVSEDSLGNTNAGGFRNVAEYLKVHKPEVVNGRVMPFNENEQISKDPKDHPTKRDLSNKGVYGSVGSMLVGKKVPFGHFVENFDDMPVPIYGLDQSLVYPRVKFLEVSRFLNGLRDH